MPEFIECTNLYEGKKLIAKDKLIFRPAAYAVVIDKGNVLLLETKHTGKYWFPGGAVELGETLEESMKRELKEETGIEIEVEKFLKVNEIFFYYDPLDEAYHNFSFFYLCKPKTTTLMADDLVDPEEESIKPRWISLKDLTEDQMQVGSKEIFQLLSQL